MGQLAEIIAGEIAKAGPISAARFMELALYCPVYGYYEAEGDKIGRQGDYFTSVSVGSLFGELLARQFVEWASADPLRGGQSADAAPEKRPALQIIEAGAHDGRLARDI